MADHSAQPGLSPSDLVARRYALAYEAAVHPDPAELVHFGGHGGTRAAMASRRASRGPLFLERYLDAPVEACVGAALGRPVARGEIVELGSLAATDGFAMVALWATASNDLAGGNEIAVATLTAPLRAMFGRMGLRLFPLAPARAERAGTDIDWGRYYASDPVVCAGMIAQGQAAIGAFLSRRRSRAA